MKGAKHRSDLRFCGCWNCNHSMHNTEYGKAQVTRTRRRFRQQVKLLCRLAKYDPYVDIPDRIDVGYL